MQHPDDFTLLEAIPITSPARTLLDLAGRVCRRDLERAIDRAEWLELFDLTAVEELLSRAYGRKGAAVLRRAVAAWIPRYTRSELEDGFAELLDTAGLPSAGLNVLVDGERGTYEVDAFWAAHSLVVQLDGFAYHRTVRDRERDAATDADLELAGYRVVRLTWGDITGRRRKTVRRLEQLLLPGGRGL